MAALVLIPSLSLIAVEAALRLGGFGYPTSFFLERPVNGQPRLIENQEFGRRFFPPGLVRYPKPMALPARKAPAAIRIFVLGESAAMGDPQPRFGFPRMLEALLRKRFPGREIEVVNASMVAVNSNVILPIAAECAGRDGDLLVVYMGNNEMIGPFGCISKFGAQAPPRPFIWASLAAKTTRVGQAMDAALSRVRQGHRPPRQWEGMSLWEDQEIHPTGPGLARVYEHFEENLRRVVEAGRKARIPVILCTVANNLRDCAPFKSVHSGTDSAASLREWQTAYEQGVALELQSRFAEANACYERALGLDDQFAELCYRAARCALASGNAERAGKLFRQARDCDALQFRADTRINDIIRRCATSYRGQGVQLLDAEALFADASPHHLPGREFFLEHVHLNPQGNYRLARGVADLAVEALGLNSPKVPTPNRPPAGTAGTNDRPKEWAPEAACLEALGFTEWNRHQLLDEIRKRIERPPFTHQVDHEHQMAKLSEEIQQCRASTKPFQMRRASRLVAQAVADRPEDPDLRWNLAELLDTARDLEGAEEQWRAVIRLLPHAHLPYYNLGKLLESGGRAAEALESYRQCLRINPEYSEAKRALTSLVARQGEGVVN